jgi:hypothetical protein
MDKHNEILTKLIGALDEAGFLVGSIRPGKKLAGYAIQIGPKEIKPDAEKQTLQDVPQH